MVRRNTRVLGSDAETRARQFLEAKGLATIERNFRRRLGEVDLVMRDGDCLVFVEVRYRRSNRFTAARLTVDHRKQRKLIRTASLFISQRSCPASCPVRFDVLAIDGESIDWIRDAFRPADNSL